MPAVELDFSRFTLRRDLPPHRQVAAFLKAQIALGALAPGDVLPGAPALAYRIRVKEPEVRRAYAELADRGLLASKGGRWRVAGPANAAREIEARLREVIEDGRRAGLSRADLQRLVKGLLAE